MMPGPAAGGPYQLEGTASSNDRIARRHVGTRALEIAAEKLDGGVERERQRQGRGRSQRAQRAQVTVCVLASGLQLVLEGAVRIFRPSHAKRNAKAERERPIVLRTNPANLVIGLRQRHSI